MKKFSVLFALLGFLLTGIVAHAQEKSIQIFDTEYVFIGSFVCLDFSLHIEGYMDEEVKLYLYPIFAYDNSTMLSVSGNPETMNDDGELVSRRTLTTLEDDFASVWDRSDENGIEICVDTWEMPLAVEDDYDFYLALVIAPETGEPVLYDSSADLDLLTMESEPATIRMTYPHYDFEAEVNDLPGIMTAFSLEIAGLEGQSVLVAVFFYDVETDEPLVGQRGYEEFTSPDGSITSQQVVEVIYDHSIWSQTVEEGDYFQLFVPYAVFPKGSTSWYPQIIVYNAETLEILRSASFFNDVVDVER